MRDDTIDHFSNNHLVSGADDAEFEGEYAPYLNGEKQAPIPTYFIGGYGLGSNNILTKLATSSSNIHHLGRAGIIKLNDLQIAYLDGTYNAAAYRATESSTSTPFCRYFTEADVERLYKECTTADGDIDILLTNDWPSDTCNGLTDGYLPQQLHQDSTKHGPPAGNLVTAQVATAIRPRYHVAGTHGVFYARLPYINADLGAGAHATRFISLGTVGNTLKQKWIHALGLLPACKMTPEALMALPEGATPSPYSEQRRRLKDGAGEKRAATDADKDDEGLGAETWRWQDKKKKRVPIAAPSLGRTDITKDKTKTAFVRNVSFQATEDDILSFFSQAGTVMDIVRRADQQGKLHSYCFVQFDTRDQMERACQLNGTELMGRQMFIEPAATEGGRSGNRRGGPVQAVEGCWFCLSNPSADVDLVVSIGEECYVAIDKGAISDTHVLILPVDHYACSLDAPSSLNHEIERYASALKSCFASEGKQFVGFERFMRLKKSGGNHCHINCIAIPSSAAQRAQHTFEKIAAGHGFSFGHHVPACSTAEETQKKIQDIVQNNEYFIAFLPDGSKLVHPILYGERHPLNYGREVLAELVGAPQKSDWKACSMSSEEEKKKVESFKKVFAPFDIMQE